MAFLQNFVSQQLEFLFSKHLDTMLIRRIVSPVKQIFAWKFPVASLEVTKVGALDLGAIWKDQS